MAIKDSLQTKRPLAAPQSRLSDRAKTRLRIAAVLVGRRGLSPEACSEDFYARVLQMIESLEPTQRNRLRGHVDWVEAYECTEVHRPRR
jgi:hypothetical protein